MTMVAAAPRRVLNRFGNFAVWARPPLSHDRGFVSGCRAFADSYRGATAKKRLAPTDFPRSVKHLRPGWPGLRPLLIALVIRHASHQGRNQHLQNYGETYELTPVTGRINRDAPWMDDSFCVRGELRHGGKIRPQKHGNDCSEKGRSREIVYIRAARRRCGRALY